MGMLPSQVTVNNCWRNIKLYCGNTYWSESVCYFNHSLNVYKRYFIDLLIYIYILYQYILFLSKQNYLYTALKKQPKSYVLVVKRI